jgi:hypothetical protein
MTAGDLYLQALREAAGLKERGQHCRVNLLNPLACAKELGRSKHGDVKGKRPDLRLIEGGKR